MFKKLLAILFSIMFSVTLFAGCSNGTPPNNPTPSGQTNSIFEKKENVIMNKQAYDGNEVKYPTKLWTESVSKRAVSNDYPLYDVRAYYIQSVDYKGAPSNFFGYFGIPETASESNPVPAVVLVHGGGGTAYADWARFWVNRGYAAIAIDTEGNIPTSPGAATNGNTNKVPHTRNPGPARSGTFLDSEKPVEEQWMYHAIASVISSVTFLSKMPEIDSSKIGCIGISWGSLIVSGTAIYDDRLAFVVPIYGSIGESGTLSREGAAMDLQPRAVELWDDESALSGRKTPFLFVNNHQDHAFSVEVQDNCAKYVANKQVCIIPDLAHDHKRPMSVKEIGIFVDNICLNKELALPEITVQPTATTGVVETKTHGTKIVSGELFYTTDERIISPARPITDTSAKNDWVIDEIDCDNNGKFEFQIPANATYYFVSVIDDAGNRSSTKLVKIGE